MHIFLFLFMLIVILCPAPPRASRPFLFRSLRLARGPFETRSSPPLSLGPSFFFSLKPRLVLQIGQWRIWVSEVPVSKITDPWHDHPALIEPFVDCGDQDVLPGNQLRKAGYARGSSDDADEVHVFGIGAAFPQSLHSRFSRAAGSKHRVEQDNRILLLDCGKVLIIPTRLKRPLIPF